MAVTVDRLAEEALRLPFSDRAELAERLLRSLAPPGEEVPEAEADQAWSEVARQRSDDVHEGRVEPIDWEVARQKLRDRLAGRSAPQPSTRRQELL
ncbi:MAG: addiction module protein [Planctomycetes bacterium]|nr:addiction module protein [Planctomycetota bacterium]